MSIGKDRSQRMEMKKMLRLDEGSSASTQKRRKVMNLYQVRTRRHTIQAKLSREESRAVWKSR